MVDWSVLLVFILFSPGNAKTAVLHETGGRPPPILKGHNILLPIIIHTSILFRIILLGSIELACLCGYLSMLSWDTFHGVLHCSTLWHPWASPGVWILLHAPRIKCSYETFSMVLFIVPPCDIEHVACMDFHPRSHETLSLPWCSLWFQLTLLLNLFARVDFHPRSHTTWSRALMRHFGFDMQTSYLSKIFNIA